MQELTKFMADHPLLTFAILVVFVLLTIIELLRAKHKIKQLTPAQVTRMINREQAVILDIRGNDAFRKGHIIDAISLTAAEIKTAPKKIEKFKNKPLIIICNTGVESQKIASSLIKQGYNAYSLAGGMRAWSEAQLPIIKE